MNKTIRNRSLLLACTLMVGGLALTSFLWVKSERRQYALNRQLIEALKASDAKQALALVDAGADPNTRIKPMPEPTVFKILNQLFNRSPMPLNDTPNALMLVCGACWSDEHGHWCLIAADTPQLKIAAGNAAARCRG